MCTSIKNVYITLRIVIITLLYKYNIRECRGVGDGRGLIGGGDYNKMYGEKSSFFRSATTLLLIIDNQSLCSNSFIFDNI